MTVEEETQVAATTHEGTTASEDTTAGLEQAVVEPSAEETTVSETAEAPVTWDGFELNGPEGHDKESLTAFGKAAQDQGVEPTAAQKMLDQIVPVLQERQMAGLDAIHKDWIAASKADPEIGGDKFDENMAIAAKGAEAYGDDDLQTLLKPVSDGGQGLGNHPAINRLLFRIGNLIKPDSEVVQGSAIPTGEEDEGAVLYPEMTRQMKAKR